MDFELDVGQRAWLTEVREFLHDNVTAELRAELAEHDLELPGGEVARFRRKIGEKGWFGLNWPKEYGGLGLGPMYQHLLMSEFEYVGVPGPDLTVTSVAPMIMRHGTEQNKKEFLPGVARGEIIFALGYSEPNAGTDLASLRTRAVRDGDEYVINGAKIFTSGADQADYVWLACRTDPDVPKHKGISILCVPTTAPGFEWSIIHTVGGLTTTQTFYDNVRVPVTSRVGEENEGWRMITTQLNHERVGLAAWSGLAISLYEDIVDWAAAQETDDGRTLIDQGWVQTDLAKCHAELEAMWLLNWRMAVHVADGELTGAESSSIKVFGTERILEVARLLS